MGSMIFIIVPPLFEVYFNNELAIICNQAPYLHFNTEGWMSYFFVKTFGFNVMRSLLILGNLYSASRRRMLNSLKVNQIN